MGTSSMCVVLDACDGWSSMAQILQRCEGIEPKIVRQIVGGLAELGILHRSDQVPPRAEQSMDTFGKWNPVAGFFHTATKDVRFAERVVAEKALARRAATRTLPAAVKPFPRARVLHLPFAPPRGEFPKVLLARRTWRRFSKKRVTLSEIGTLLGLTAGFHQFVLTGPSGRSPQRTSPSGGARHPVEPYVLSRNVSGLPEGLYHYDSAVHGLHRIRDVHTRGVQRYLPAQDWFEGAAAIVFFAAVFGRTSWRYDNARAYRAVLIEAGHLAQTFCLSATWLGLAPFCTMAIADREIEQDLGLDGISESVVYAAGVGCRAAPASDSFAPAGVTAPPIAQNPSFSRARSS
jgi:SagB-type dehydrogenase family enzyme